MVQQKAARRKDWKADTMQGLARRLHSDLKFNSADFEAIQFGLVPYEIGDKWFMFMEGDWLYMHHSWTGYCAYKIRFEQDGFGSMRIAEIWASEHDQYSNRPNAISSEIIEVLLVHCLIRRNKRMIVEATSPLQLWPTYGKSA